MFSGRNQFRLSTILSNTDVIDAIMQKYYNDRDFIVAGTSAGAMAAAAIMVYEEQNAEPGTPLCVENLRVHILEKANRFLLKERKFVFAKADLNRQKESVGKKIIYDQEP